MTSTVTNYSNNIDITVPVAGIDNSSQKFRDNFSNISNALSVAANEISDLQTNTVNTLNPVNDLAFNTVITRVTLQNSGLVANNDAANSANLAGVIPVDYTLGSYQKITVSGTSTFSVANWPAAGIYAPIRLEISCTTPGTLTFNASQSTPPGNSPLSRDIPYASTSSVNTTTIWDLWTTDGGTNVFVKFVGGPY